ncbi:hypothetical protein Trydic_g5441 [Trypoxylus dichotomus]
MICQSEATPPAQWPPLRRACASRFGDAHSPDDRPSVPINDSIFADCCIPRHLISCPKCMDANLGGLRTRYEANQYPRSDRRRKRFRND